MPFDKEQHVQNILRTFSRMACWQRSSISWTTSCTDLPYFRFTQLQMRLVSGRAFRPVGVRQLSITSGGVWYQIKYCSSCSRSILLNIFWNSVCPYVSMAPSLCLTVMSGYSNASHLCMSLLTMYLCKLCCQGNIISSFLFKALQLFQDQ